MNSYVLRVGGRDADIPGFDSNAIQIAADVLKARGGGTIELSEGTFIISGPVRLSGNTHLHGQGKATILKKSAGCSSAFAQDIDYGVVCACLSDPGGFRPGTGILIQDDLNAGGWSVSTSKITSVCADNIYFDRRTLMDYVGARGGVVTNACSVVEAVKVENVKISDLAIDGSKESNFRIDGCRGGAVYLHKAKNCQIDNISVCNFNGDGISWQITEDISVRGSEVFGCTGFGLHPGSGSHRTLVQCCSLHENGIDGLFVCWRVVGGVFRNNRIFSNQFSGISIGHRDTDNVFEENHIYDNGNAGILVREENEGNRAERNIYRGNTVENNGGAADEGCGFRFEGRADGNRIEQNIIRDTGTGRQKIGIGCRDGGGWLVVRNNTMSGHSKGDFFGL
jgi:hypothetical protein